ncbi:hypothetical protein PGTUg99_030868 [Puccinia graminis f. sp. tritici]|uniref:Uncharacterized protein n=1 Tax=Puccinia graminis f. sp. tritici TaxID=56615 RepID=A0A5B0SL63_PUCGR|nr:hypothetical protein PGTUg99_030868 [Puccinia graminis f. sp. tritici]
MPSEEPIPNLGSSHSEHEGSHEENITDDGQDVEVAVFFTIYVNMPPRQGHRGMITWKVYVSNSASGLFSQRNNMILTPGIFEEWKDEIRHSRRGQAKISIQQPKPSQESTADEEAAVEGALHEMHGANGGPSENRDQPGNITKCNKREEETPPLNDFALSATICELYNIHCQAGNLHRSFPVFRNPINSTKAIILNPSAMGIWAEAILKPEPGVDLHHPPSSLRYQKIKNHNNRRDSPRPPTNNREHSPNPIFSTRNDTTLDEYLDFCHFPRDRWFKALQDFCNEQYVKNYQIFTTNLVVNSLVNDYHFPVGLVASLRENVPRFTANLRANPRRQTSARGQSEDEDHK